MIVQAWIWKLWRHKSGQSCQIENHKIFENKQLNGLHLGHVCDVTMKLDPDLYYKKI